MKPIAPYKSLTPYGLVSKVKIAVVAADVTQKIGARAVSMNVTATTDSAGFEII